MEENITKDYPVKGFQSVETNLYTPDYSLNIKQYCFGEHSSYRLLLADYRDEQTCYYSCTLDEVAQAIMSIGILSPLEPETLETLVTSNQDGLGVKI